MPDSLDAWLYDGITARRQVVRATLVPGSIIVDGLAPIPIADLIDRGDDHRVVFGRKDESGWRLGFDQPLPPDWRAALPHPSRYGALIDRIGLVGAVIGGIAISALVLFGLWIAPQLIAPLVPPSVERKLGDAIVGDMGGQACVDPSGQAILDDLARRLSRKGDPLRVRVVDIPIPNAVALPGGQIALFNGIIQQAKSPDEVAGVLAHEIGHVDHRHVMAGLIRQFGFGLVLGGNSHAAEYADMLLSARYSRDAEREADAFAIQRLTANHISTRPTAEFFARLARHETTGNKRLDSAFSWLASHPVSQERRDAFNAADAKIVAKQPAISEADWKIVRAMCKSHHDDKR